MSKSGFFLLVHFSQGWHFSILHLIIRMASSEVLRPKLIVFDLDYTLWPFWIDTHVYPPFKKQSDGKIFDSYGNKIKWYKDVPDILKTLHSEGYLLAIASRTSCTEEAKELVQLLDWDKYFSFREIYPGCKVSHFNRFRDLSGISFREMMFFDDEHRNIVDISKLGVTCILAEGGMSNKLLEEGFRQFKLKKTN